ncbi:MAG: hypothetical protein Fur0022_11000 [Anaerolineales bacterium]
MDMEQPFELLDTPIEAALPRGEYAIAKLISGIFSPPLMVTASLLFLAQAISANAVAWALFQIGVGILIPVIFIVVQVQRGVITDFHMRVREQRIVPMIFALVCAGVSWGVMQTWNAPFALRVFSGIAILQSAFMLLVTFKWKISGHSMTIAGMAVFLVGMFGAAAAPLLLAIPLVAWARVRLNRHDRWQTLAGAVAGVGFTLFGLYLFYRTCGGMDVVCQ